MKDVCPHIVKAWRECEFSEQKIAALIAAGRAAPGKKHKKRRRPGSKEKETSPVLRSFARAASVMLSEGAEISDVIREILDKGKARRMSKGNLIHACATAYLANAEGVDIEEFHPLCDASAPMVSFAFAAAYALRSRG